MFSAIYKFELNYNLKRMAPYIFFALVGFQAYLDASNINPNHTYISVHGQVVHNAPATIANLLLVMSIFGGIFTIIFAATPVVRDFENKIHEFYFSSPITKLGYLAGRFGGGLTVVALIFLGAMLGYLIGCLTLEARYIGPFRLLAFLQPFLLFLIPNLLLMGVVFFALAALTRNMIATYVSGIASLVGYLSLQDSFAQPKNQQLMAWLDPFGFSALALVKKYWTVAELNANLIPLDGVVLYNRLLWLAVAALVFAGLYFKFQFAQQNDSRRKKQIREATEIEYKGIRQLAQLPSVARSFKLSANLQKLWALVKLEARRIVLHPAFFILTILAARQAYHNFVENVSVNGSNVYPFTSWYLQFSVDLIGYMTAITIFFASVLVWRERDNKSEEIYDAIAVPDWLLFAAKFVTLISIQTVFTFAVLLTGLFAQGVIFGYTDFELPLYCKALLGIELINYWHLAIVALLIQTLVSNKYVGISLTAAYFIVDFLLFSGLELTSYLQRFGLTPEYVYSNMNGFGHYAKPILWYRLYWAFGAIILLIASDLLWRRGQEIRLKLRWRAARQRLTRKHVLGLGLALIGFMFMGGFIYYNNHILNTYVTTNLRQQQSADFEKRYGRYAKSPQPSITHVNLQVELFPARGDAAIKGSYWVTNKTNAAVDSVHLWLAPDRVTTIKQLSLQRPAQLATCDAELGYYIFALQAPLLPDDSTQIVFDLEASARGFTENNPRNEVVENGSYLTNFPFARPLYFPAIGYSRWGEIRDNVIRAKYGLPEKKMLPALEDSLARQKSFLDWATFDCIVSTDQNQTAVATGELMKSWQENNRNFYHYRVDTVMNNAFVILSGKYEVARARHKNIGIEIYYDKKHSYNIDRMIAGVKTAFDYCTENFSPYPYKTVRIVEVPDYGIIGGTARSQPTVFTWTENGGFISNLEDSTVIDVVFNTTTHEMAHQWWGHIVKAAETEGAAVLAETMAQWVRAMCMQQKYGAEKMHRFRQNEMDDYLSSRARQQVDEPPLLRSTTQAYLNYDKGTLVMYALQDYIGEARVNAALRKLVEQFGFKDAPYPTTLDLIAALREVTPDSLQFVITDLFETITLYDNKVEEVKCTMLANGKFQVNLKTQMRKLRADGKGNETEIAMLDYMDIGIFGESGRILYLAKHKITRNNNEFVLVVAEKPVEAGVDPFVKLIDKNRDNNRAAVQFVTSGTN